MSYKSLLAEGLKQLNCEHVDEQQLLEYIAQLHRWNQVYNLTAIRNPSDMITRHLLDSLAILPWVQGFHLLDVGSGGGLPGIPLAIANPQWNVVLLDSNGKKARFLQEVKRTLSLENVTIVHARAENYHPEHCFDTVLSRALGSLDQIITWTKHLIVKDGIWLAMKGEPPEQELQQLPYSYDIKEYAVSGLDAQRCCVIIKNT